MKKGKLIFSKTKKFHLDLPLVSQHCLNRVASGGSFLPCDALQCWEY